MWTVLNTFLKHKKRENISLFKFHNWAEQFSSYFYFQWRCLFYYCVFLQLSYCFCFRELNIRRENKTTSKGHWLTFKKQANKNNKCWPAMGSVDCELGCIGLSFISFRFIVYWVTLAMKTMIALFIYSYIILSIKVDWLNKYWQM